MLGSRMLSMGRWAMLRGFAVLLAVSLLALLAACAGEGGDDEAVGDLESLASEAAEGVVAKVTYKITTDVGGQGFEQEWLVVQRPPDSRFELSSTEGAAQFRTIIISSGGKTHLCFSNGGEESCLETSAEEAEVGTAPFDPIFDISRELAEEAEGVDIIDRSQRRIAGVDASCFMVRSALPALGDGEVCFSAEGILLLLRSELDNVSSTIEATSVSTDVTDEDFELPYELFMLPEFGIPTIVIPDP